jgi:hypothetical protein
MPEQPDSDQDFSEFPVADPSATAPSSAAPAAPTQPVAATPTAAAPAPNASYAAGAEDYRAGLQSLINNGASRSVITGYIAAHGVDPAQVQGLDEAIATVGKGHKVIIPVQLTMPANTLAQQQTSGQAQSAPEDFSEFPVYNPAKTAGGEVALGARHLLEGVAEIPDALASVGGLITGDHTAPLATNAVDSALDRMGVPRDSTNAERLMGKIIEGATGGALTAPLGGEGALIGTIAAGATGAGAGEAARQAGYGPGVQLAANLVGGVAGGEAAAARLPTALVPDATSIAATADRLGVTPMPATVGGNFDAGVQKMLGTVPGGAGVIHAAARNEVEQLGQVAHNAAAQIGEVGTPASVGAAISSGANAYAQASKSAGGALYRARDAAFGGSDAPVSMDGTRAAIAAIKEAAPNAPALADLTTHPAINRLARALPGASPDDPDAGILTLGEATSALSHVRYVLRSIDRPPGTPGAQPPVVVAKVRAVEQAMKDDVINAAWAADQAARRSVSDPGSAVGAQHDADAFWAKRAETLAGPLKKPLGSFTDDIKVSPESVYNGLAADARRQGGNLGRFQETWSKLPKATRDSFAATQLDDLGRSTSGAQNDLGTNWSFNTFGSNWDRLDPRARAMMFGGTEQSQTIDDIARYSARLKDIGAQRNTSNTASHMLAGGFWAETLSHLLSGQPLKAAATIGGAAVTRPVAKVFLATPAMRAWTRDALRTAVGTAKTGTVSPSAILPLNRRLGAIAANSPAIANDVLGLQEKLAQAFAPAPGQMAAQPTSSDRSGKNR